jgi:hypothetical protein
MDERLKLVIIAITLRLLFAPFFAHIWDVNTLQVSLYELIHGKNPYEKLYTNSITLQNTTKLPIFYEGYAYLPHIILILAPFYFLYLFLGCDPQPIKNVYDPAHPLKVFFSHDIYLFLFIIKLPLILIDALIVLKLYEYSKYVALAYAVSPYSVFITSVWGMFDNILAYFLLVTLTYLKNEKWLRAGMAYSVALSKLYAVYAAPIILVYVFKKGGLKACLRFLKGLALLQIPTLIFFILDPKAFLYIITFHGTRFGGGVTPLNVLWVIEDVEFNVTISRIVTLLNIALWIGITIYVALVNMPLEKGILLTIMVPLFLGKIVNEQYFLSIYPLLLLLIPGRAEELGRYLVVFALLNTSPAYIMLPLLSAVRIAHFIPFSYLLLNEPTILSIRKVALYVIGVLFFMKIIHVIFSLITQEKFRRNVL